MQDGHREGWPSGGSGRVQSARLRRQLEAEAHQPEWPASIIAQLSGSGTAAGTCHRRPQARPSPVRSCTFGCRQRWRRSGRLAGDRPSTNEVVPAAQCAASPVLDDAAISGHAYGAGESGRGDLGIP